MESLGYALMSSDRVLVPSFYDVESVLWRRCFDKSSAEGDLAFGVLEDCPEYIFQGIYGKVIETLVAYGYAEGLDFIFQRRGSQRL